MGSRTSTARHWQMSSKRRSYTGVSAIGCPVVSYSLAYMHADHKAKSENRHRPHELIASPCENCSQVS